MKLNETSLPNNYSKGLFEEKTYDLAPEHTDKIATIAFTAVSNILQAAKSKDHATAFTFETISGKVVACAIVQYFENEDPSNPGNWNLVWSFDENDIPDGANRINFKDPASHPYFRAIAGDKYGIRFKDPSAIVTLHTYFFEQLRKWLDENADANKEVSIELETIFVARVAVENGEKVFALEPAGEMKVLIKDDAAIEK